MIMYLDTNYDANTQYLNMENYFWKYMNMFFAACHIHDYIPIG